MILAVTLNPCLDKTLTVPAWEPGDSVRGRETRAVVGGKGNNVARALKRLGRTVRPISFFGGPTGDLCEDLLKAADQLDPIVIRSQAETRVILTVRKEGSNEQTAFFDPDPAISESEAVALLERVRGEIQRPGQGVEAITLSGSSPSMATHHLYADLIQLAKSQDVPVFLDAYGPALEAVQEEWPTAIQVNQREARLFARSRNLADYDEFSILKAWAKQGVKIATITNGPGLAMVVVGERPFRVQPPEIEPVNPIGSGDSMLAGLVDGWLSGLAPDLLIRRAFGAGIANALVWDAGAITPEEVDRQGARVVVNEI